jgi:hypothetical protein
MDAVAALNPYDAFEARLAARIVGMDAHAADSLRSAGLAAADPAEMHRCRAQAASMARQSDAALRSLLRMQATREKQLAARHPAAMERAGYWFREITAEAEQYAVTYPDRAARIRAAGGLPTDLDFGPPEPELVHAVVHSTSPIVQAHARQRHNGTGEPARVSASATTSHAEAL